MISDLIEQIEKSLKNFKKDVLLKKLNVYILVKDLPNAPLLADWDSFDLILFNIIHNAIKFNC